MIRITVYIVLLIPQIVFGQNVDNVMDAVKLMNENYFNSTSFYTDFNVQVIDNNEEQDFMGGNVSHGENYYYSNSGVNELIVEDGISITINHVSKEILVWRSNETLNESSEIDKILNSIEELSPFIYGIKKEGDIISFEYPIGDSHYESARLFIDTKVGFISRIVYKGKQSEYSTLEKVTIDYLNTVYNSSCTNCKHVSDVLRKTQSGFELRKEYANFLLIEN